MSKDKATQKINSRVRTNEKKGFFPILIVIVAVVAVMIVGIVIITFVGKESEGNLVVTPENVQEMLDSINAEEKTPIGSYEAKMTTHWHFKDWETASEDAYVENSVYNSNTVYFTISLDGKDGDIYKSPYIPVGSTLEQITLTEPLEKGKHSAVLTYHLVDESYEEISKVSVSITITIEQ